MINLAADAPAASTFSSPRAQTQLMMHTEPQKENKSLSIWSCWVSDCVLFLFCLFVFLLFQFRYMFTLFVIVKGNTHIHTAAGCSLVAGL